MASTQPTPAWLTDELADVDEWIDWDDEQESRDPDQSGSELSFTQPIGSLLVSNSDIGTPSAASASDASGGTFVIREEIPAIHLLPKTPGRNNKAAIKDFFSPLALEKMFEPPSPPHPSSSALPHVHNAPPVPSRLSQVHVPLQSSFEETIPDQDEDEEAHLPGVSSAPGLLAADPAQSKFTFTAPRPSPFNPAGPAPDAQSTPGPRGGTRNLNPPGTDPRLRLFQFQYDTFTRDHLSAMVDSIAVNTPSGDGGGSAPRSFRSTPSGLSPVNETSFSRLRSAKRVKLSPSSDFSNNMGDGAAAIMRPDSRRDYVGESRNLMEQIRKARDFSTVSTVASESSPKSRGPSVNVAKPDAGRPAFLTVPSGNESSKDPSPTGTVDSSKRSAYSSLAYRQQGASLLAQIRNDMKGSKRLFSGETETSHFRNDDTTEMSIANPDDTVPSLRSKNGDIPALLKPRRSGDLPSSRRQPSFSGARLPSSARGKSRLVSSPRKPSMAIRPTHSAHPSADQSQNLTAGFAQMSLESSHVLAQFPSPPAIPPLRVVSASTSIASGSPTKQAPGLLAPPSVPAYPSSSLRIGRNEDMTRFVSSSTASGTTVTTGSAESFVKHPGPKQMMQITPNDVPALPERVGKMVFDRVTMRWVKASVVANAPDEQVQEDGYDAEDDLDNDSEDPFRDIESFREEDEDSPTHTAPPQHHQDTRARGRTAGPAELDEEEIEDVEEAELTSFSTDGPSHEFIRPEEMHTREDDEDTSYTDSEAPTDGDTGRTLPTATLDLQLQPRYGSGSGLLNDVAFEPAFADTPPRFLVTASPDLRQPLSAATPLPAPRSALKSTSATPISALKNPNQTKFETPANRSGHRRSVSFSDGKREGPIIGIGRNIPSPAFTMSGDEGISGPSTSRDTHGADLVPSARTNRIAAMLDDLENTDLEDDSPSKASSLSRPLNQSVIQPRRTSSLPNTDDDTDHSTHRRLSSRGHPSAVGGANATFLTECSFAVTHDRLVKVITDVQPYEPYWDQLASIDLSNRNLDSTARLKEFLPRLDSLSLNSNQLSWLSGVPGTVRTLSVASNMLSGVTSFSHLLNLENLDISHNQIDSLRHLECLHHLRELRADGNHIADLDGLQQMDGLIKLSVQENALQVVDLHEYRWTRLEMLSLGQNRINSVGGLASIPSLVALNLDNNALGEFESDVTMPRLRILRLSGNRLQTLNASPFPNLRTLYADNNNLGQIIKAHRLGKLENLSLRNQSGRGLSLSMRDVRDVKRLYLSGNPLKPGFFSEPCYNLIYLELAACRLITLPADFSRTVPNVRVLNLNYNFLEDPRPLDGLSRLRKLTIIGSRIKGAKQLLRMLRGMKDLEMIDFRMNPCTLGWYLPLLVKDAPGALQPSDGDRAMAHPALGPGPIGGAGPEASRHPNSSSSSPREGHDRGGHPRPALPPGVSGARAEPSASSTVSASTDAALAPEPAARRERGRHELVWRELDAKFRRDLPDEAYIGRLAYRGLVMRTCPRITLLDGVEVERKERDKAERLIRNVFGPKAQGGASREVSVTER
ncbi:uncharacterized protein BXZ73DRAFT_50337 [Epithele typhae]|uniref:uncharacterized protein n=1 Tax=Epithele typhae TaxID=378194 RepID=UPI00200795A8|nr:uncharacterized protein BXZ73DRAFT_50337 [Epithele typhae]KAH9924609.1 hypothetical protein BXZ73DRAFT_50337 [Epithele typhae]